MTTTFSMTLGLVKARALALVDAVADGASPTANDLLTAGEAINLILKEWASKGLKPWAVSNISFPFVASKVSWTIGPTGDVTPNRPQVILDAWWQDSNQQVFPMFPCSKERFFKLSPRNQTGQPTNWYYDAQLINGVFHPWPLCLDANGTFYATCQFALQDAVNDVDPIQVAPSVFNALVWATAYDLCGMYKPHPDVWDRIEKRATLLVNEAMNLEEEQGSVQFQPAPRYGR